MEGKKLLALGTSPYRNTFSQGISTWSNTRIESFSSRRLDSG